MVNPIFDEVLKKLKAKPGETIRVLDTGTGTGIIVNNLKQRLDTGLHNSFSSIKYYGIDCLEHLIKQNKKIAPDINWLCADNKDIPFADEFFDIVFSRASIYYEESRAAQDKVICEAYRVLKPSGSFINYSFVYKLDSEVNLLNSLYKVLPKNIRANTFREFMSMHKNVFGNAICLPNPSSRYFCITASAIRTRYDIDSKQQQKICNTISDVPQQKRQHFYTDGQDFWFIVPNRIVQCIKEELSKKDLSR